MKIRMLSISAGPNGLLDADHVVEVSDAKGRELIATLHAVPAEPEAKVTARWKHGEELSFPPKKDGK